MTPSQQVKQEAEKRYPFIKNNKHDAFHKMRQEDFISGFEYGQSQPLSFKIEFTDCWEHDKNIPESHRWMAHWQGITAVTASTKEKAFNEAMKSILVMAAYQSGIPRPSPPTTDKK